MRDLVRQQAVNLPGAGRFVCDYAPPLVLPNADAAACVDKILKGAKLSDSPIKQSTTFELVVNLRTAKALDHDPGVDPSASR